MLYLRKNIFSVVMIMLLALVIISCERREDYIGPNVSSEYIQFGVFDPFEQTRAVAYKSNKIVANYVLTDEESSDSLFMSSTISDISLDQSIMTRASALTAAPTTFTLCGYRDGDLEIDTTKFTSSNLSGGVYSFSPAEYWPGSGDKNFQFYAYANAPTENFEFKTSQNSSVPTLTYTVPNDITKQVDLVVAKAIAKDDGSGLTTAGVVPLEFNHMLTAIKFEKGAIEDGYIITNIEIRGVYGSGSLDFSKNLNYDQVWTLSGDKTNFSCDRSGLNELDAENPVYFMMMPQELVGAYVYITYTTGSTTKTLSTRVQGTWLPGKVVTYTIGITPQLDLYFDMPNNLYIDAHYVMDDNLKIHVGAEVTSWKLEIGQLNANGDFVNSGADWLKFNNGLHKLETEGWWIVDENGNQRSNRVSTISSFVDGKIWLFAEENIGDEIRTAVIRLTGSGRKNNQTLTRTMLYTVRQFAVEWRDFKGTKIGSEKIEEYPDASEFSDNYSKGAPWGDYYVGSESEFKMVYTVSGWDIVTSTIGGWIAQWLGTAGVYSEGSIYGSFPNYKKDYIFTYTDVVNDMLEKTSSRDDGKTNTQNGWSVVLGVVANFQNTLVSNYGAVLNSEKSTCTKYEFPYSAFLSVLRRNAIKFTENNGNPLPDIQNSEIKWFLPAVNQVKEKIYQESAEPKYFETKIDNIELGNVFWTSTGCSTGEGANIEYSSETAYSFEFNTNPTDNDFNETYKNTKLRVRAVRQK